MPKPQETFKVFISHATIADSDLANWIADALDLIHIRAFVYERYQTGGQNRFDVIKDMISLCPYFLVVLTREGIASQWVNQEIGYAVGKGKKPIPIIEVDSSTGRCIDSKGFVELHDPINYYKNDRIQLMADIVYTFRNLLARQGKWKDIIYLRCKCGNEFDANLNFDEHWEQWNERPIEEIPQWELWRQPQTWGESLIEQAIVVSCTCDECQREIRVSFPDCHQLPDTSNA